MEDQPTPLTLRYYSNQSQPRLIRGLVTAVIFGAAALLGVRIVFEFIQVLVNAVIFGAAALLGVRNVLKPTILFGPWAWVAAGAASVMIFRNTFTLFRKGTFRPWCQACRRRVPLHIRIIGLWVTLDDVKSPSKSAILSLLRRGDWSPLRGAQLPELWGDPSVFIGLGRCERCRGPFIVFAEIRCTDKNILYVGSEIFGEVDKDSARDLLDAARRNGLFLPGKTMSMWARELDG